MLSLPPITLRLRGWKLIDRVALAFLLLCAIALGAACGLLFVYASDLPEIRALETYRPNVVTEVYADDGQLVGSFALQRRILMTYEQCPKVLYNAVTAIEDQHYEEHWGIDFPRIAGAAGRKILKGGKTQGASTITMQLAGNLFLDRSEISFRRKMQETLLALQIERRYTKPQIFTMYANQVYLAHGNYGFAAAAQFYFGKPVTDLKLQEAALLAGMIRGPVYSPLSDPARSLARRNLVLRRMEEEGKITPTEEEAARKTPLGLHIQYPRNDLAPYFFEDARKYLESTYGTEAVHERGLRVYTTLNINMQRAANQAVRDGLHSYDRRHGWRGDLPNIVRDNLGPLDSYEDEDWRHPIEKGSYLTGLVLSVEEKNATVKIGRYRAILSPSDFAWTGRKKPAELLKVGDLAQFSIQELHDSTVRVQLEQQPAPQGAMIAIDNPTGEIKAMVGGYSFEDSKFNRATQAFRQVGSSFKVYVYADALEKGSTPFDTILDAPFTTVSGGQSYSPHNYDEKFEGTITLRRALAGSRNVPAVKLAEKVGISSVVDMTRRFGITTPLPPYLPLARLGLHGLPERRHPHRSAHDPPGHQL
jgi:penicillin-binding protein 1A